MTNHRKLEPNYVSISNTGINLGDKVANFFRKKNITHVNIILDYKNKSIILWGDVISPEDVIEHKGKAGLIGNKIDYMTNRPGISPRIKFNFERFIEIRFTNLYKARPFNNTSVIIDKPPFKKTNFINSKFVIDTEEQFMLFGRLKVINDFNREYLDKKQLPSPSQLPKATIPERVVTKSIVNEISTPIKEPKQVAENTPTSDDIESANKEYSKMILGE